MELGYWACLGVHRRDTALLTITTTATAKKKSNVGWAVVRMPIAKIPNPTAKGLVQGDSVSKNLRQRRSPFYFLTVRHQAPLDRLRLS